MARLPAEDPDSEQFATPEETLSAWKALTEDDKKRVAAWARVRADQNKFADPGITGDDLLQEATMLALNGTRHWKLKEITFVQFMFGLIRSISGDLARTKAGKVRAGSIADEVLLADQKDERHPQAILEEREEEAATQAKLEALQLEFEGDEETFYVLECLREGMKPREVRQNLNLSEKAFDAARKKIGRRIRKLNRAN